jgi:bifunctional DNase/RNase
LTHDAWADSIRLLGGSATDVVLDRLANDTYFASISFNRNGELLLLDLRPSDAFVMALLADCPIFIAEEVLQTVLDPGKPKW